MAAAEVVVEVWMGRSVPLMGVRALLQFILNDTSIIITTTTTTITVLR